MSFVELSRIAVVMALLAAAPLPALASDPTAPDRPAFGHDQWPAGQSGIGAARFREGMLSGLEELSLTPTQQQAIRRVTEAYHARGLDLAQRAADIRAQMLAVAPDDAAYADATARSSEAAAVLAADAVRMAAELRAEIHALLSAEQRETLRQRALQQRQRWDDWRQRHSPPG